MITNYRRGSTGQEVLRLQQRLRDLDLYRGPVDGVFGGETEVAVRRFQRGRGLDPDGIVGARTWRALLPEDSDLPQPALLQRPVEFRCLALTGTFETSTPPPDCFACITGDFDGQGLSFGALQFNIGQRTLQALLDEMDRRHAPVVEDVFDSRVAALRSMLRSDLASQLAFARGIQDPRGRVHEPWRGMFLALGRTPECQALQLEHAGRYLERAKALCARFGVGSPRALALLFDIMVQNGGIPAAVAGRIDADIAALDPGGDPLALEQERLRIIANRRADAANPRWVEDVRERKLCIANGRGRVHGAFYDLEEQYGLSLQVERV